MPSKAKRKSLRKLHFEVPKLALLHHEGHARRLEADPGIEPLREARLLAERPQDFHALAVDEAEIACAFGQGDFAEAGEEPVEQMGEAALDPGLVGAVRALAVDHEIAVPPALHEGLDHLRRMLQVGIHDHHRIAPGMVEPGRDGDLLAEIAAEGDRADPRLVTARPRGSAPGYRPGCRRRRRPSPRPG